MLLQEKNIFILFPIALAVFLSPFDSFPYAPIHSVYRPICFIPLIMTFFHGIYSRSLDRYAVLILLLCLLLLIHTIIMPWYNGFPYQHLSKAIISVFILYISLTSLYFFWSTPIASYNEKLLIIGKAAFFSLIISFLFCCVQLLPKVFVMTDTFSQFLTSLVSYRSVGRIQGVSGEPAQFIRNILMLGLLSTFLNKGALKYIAAAISLFCILVSGSTYGYVTILILILFYIILFDNKLILNRIFVLYSLSIFLLFFLYYSFFMGPYTKQKITRLTRIIKEPTQIQEVTKIDASIFSRITNPYIAFTARGVENVFGTGLDTYRYIYPEQVIYRYPYGLSFEIISKQVLNDKVYVTPKSLYAKIFLELGWAAFLLMSCLYVILYYSIIKRSTLKANKLATITFCLLLVYPLNTDSIIFFNFIFLISLLLEIFHQHLFAYKNNRAPING